LIWDPEKLEDGLPFNSTCGIEGEGVKPVGNWPCEKLEVGTGDEGKVPALDGGRPFGKLDVGSALVCGS
jgi:hypothetical protein